MILTIIYFVVIFICIGVAVFIAVPYFLIPINHAFDDAPERLKTIYDTLIVAFTSAIAYFLFQEKRRRKIKRKAEERRQEEQLQVLKDLLEQGRQRQNGN